MRSGTRCAMLRRHQCGRQQPHVTGDRVMDAQTFDRLTASVAHQRSRRGALRLLAGGVLAGLLSPRLTRAMQADRDGDGLFDDDETNVYGTNPDLFDTDGDGVG